MNQKNSINNPKMIALLAISACLLWGSAFPMIKIGYNSLGILPEDIANQILFAGQRFTLAGMMVIIIKSIMERKLVIPKKGQYQKIIYLSFFQTILQYICFYIGLAKTDGARSAIIIGSNVFITLLISALVFRLEKLTLRKCVGCLLGFLGILLVNMKSGTSTFEWRMSAEGLILLSACASAISSALMKRYATGEDPIMLSGYQFLWGGLVMATVGIMLGGKIQYNQGESIAILIYLGFLSAMAYTLWAILLKHNPVSKVTIFGFTNPIFGSLLSIIILKEDISTFGIKGMIALILISTGIFVVNKQSSI